MILACHPLDCGPGSLCDRPSHFGSRGLMTKFIATVYALVMICVAVGVRADEKPDGALPARVATHHSTMIGGARLDYEAVAETLLVTDAKGATTASIFTTSYLADSGPGNQRAVSF